MYVYRSPRQSIGRAQPFRLEHLFAVDPFQIHPELVDGTVAQQRLDQRQLANVHANLWHGGDWVSGQG